MYKQSVVAEIRYEAEKEYQIKKAECKLGEAVIEMLKEAKGEPLVIRLNSKIGLEFVPSIEKPLEVYRAHLRFETVEQTTDLHPRPFAVEEDKWYRVLRRDIRRKVRALGRKIKTFNREVRILGKCIKEKMKGGVFKR